MTFFHRVAVAFLLLTALSPLASGPVRAATAEEIVDRMVEAHGGMKAWKEAPSVSFTDAWTRPGADEPRVSRVIVEQGARRARLEVEGSDAVAAWDGEKAWSLNWESPAPPRFLVALNYYFVNLPWLAKDPGVILGDPGTQKLRDDDTGYISIRVTFEPGVGDTPDDYYVLFIDPETYRLHGCEYIVTYAPLLPEGVESTPPHELIFESFETVGGLVVPTSFTIYEDGAVYASCRIRDWSFSKPFDDSLVAMPEGAVVDTSLDG